MHNVNYLAHPTLCIVYNFLTSPLAFDHMWMPHKLNHTHKPCIHGDGTIYNVYNGTTYICRTYLRESLAAT